MNVVDHAALLAAAIVFEAVFGYPKALYLRIGHPVTWIGAVIEGADRFFNRAEWPKLALRSFGIVLALVLPFFCAWFGWMLASVVPLAVEILFIAILLASRSLFDHVTAVQRALHGGNLDDARQEVAKIVGRDTVSMDDAGVARAAIETLAENASDGVIAPILWGLLFGLPGVLAYKAINTADSMIGHRSERHADFGWAAARVDDAANLIPARLTAVLFAVGALLLPHARPVAAWHTAWTQAHRHLSPNAGWPEAAMAGALRIQLGGPRSYDGLAVPGQSFGPTHGKKAEGEDIVRALKLYVVSMTIAWVVCLAIALTG